MIVKIKLGNGAVVPRKANVNDAGYDLYTAEDIVIKGADVFESRESGMSHRTIIKTNLHIELPDPCSKWWWKLASKVFGICPYVYYASVLPRSGFSSKGIEGSFCNERMTRNMFDADVIIGIIDQPYTGGIGCIVRNKDMDFVIKKGTKVAQMIIGRSYVAEFDIVDELSESTRGSNGFGSSGTA